MDYLDEFLKYKDDKEIADLINNVRNKGDVSTFVYNFLDIIYKSSQKTESIY